MRFVLRPANPNRDGVLERALGCIETLDPRRDWQVTVEPYEELRTLDQNAKLWATLQDIADQVEWTVDGKLTLMSKEDWKDVFTAALKREQRVTQGLEGGFVILGARTSRMSKRTMSDLLELITSFGAERGVRWSEPMQEAA